MTGAIENSVHRDLRELVSTLHLMGMPATSTSTQLRIAVKELLAEHAKRIDVVLHCPSCKEQHIDRPDYPSWTNPPHKTHQCHFCGVLWTPSARPTNGVRALPPGSSATWPIVNVDLFDPAALPAREQGTVFHPDFPDMGDDEEIITPFLWQLGYECSYVAMEDDDAELYERLSEAADGDFSDWTPTPPKGEAWRLVAMYDTEDGPCALYVRPFSQLVGCAT